MKMIDHNHFICHLILGTFTEYPNLAIDNFTSEIEPVLRQKEADRCLML